MVLATPMRVGFLLLPFEILLPSLFLISFLIQKKGFSDWTPFLFLCGLLAYSLSEKTKEELLHLLIVRFGFPQQE